jgi:hypothetical protein
MASRIQYRRDTASNWTSSDPVLAAGEPGYETDTGKEKVGDGSTAWTSLAYAGGGGAVGPDLTDIDSITSTTGQNLQLVAKVNATIHAGDDTANPDITITPTATTIHQACTLDNGFTANQDSSANQKLTVKKDAGSVVTQTAGSGDTSIDFADGSLQMFTISGGDLAFTSITNAANGDHGKIIVKQPASAVPGGDVAWQFKDTGSILAPGGGATNYLGGQNAYDQYSAFTWVFIDGVAIVTSLENGLYT